MKVKKHIQMLILPVLLAALTWFFCISNAFYSLDKLALDALCQKKSVANKKIYIIAIDDKTLERYGSVNSWTREIPAMLVEQLMSDDKLIPAVVAFDIIYSEKGDEKGDLHFAQACSAAQNVVVAMTYNFKTEPQLDESGEVYYDYYYIDNAVWPYEELKAQTYSGFANTIVDPDGYVRETMAQIESEGTVTYSFASEVYRAYMRATGKTAVFPETYDHNRYCFSYTGKTGCYNTVSLCDVLDQKVDPQIFTDAIVFVGAYAVGMQDNYKPAISHGQQMYGVEIQANIVEALLEGKTQIPFSHMLYSILAAIVAGLFAFLISKCNIKISTVLIFLFVFFNLFVTKLMYQVGYIIPVMVLSCVLLIGYLCNLIIGYIEEILRRKRVVDVFKKYVSPQVVDKISRKKDFEIVLGGENRHIAVLFVDIRGFTTMSESLEPEEVVEILNEYLSLTTKAIFDNGGTLDKFVGDATMAVFNAPFDLDHYIYRAVCAARDMKAGADSLAAKFEEKYGKSVAFGIGVNCGNAVVGNIGCEFRMDYTAIGDTVNTAARLESNAGRGQILISQEVYEAIKDMVTVTEIGEIPLKGKSKGVFVYQVDEVR